MAVGVLIANDAAAKRMTLQAVRQLQHLAAAVTRAQCAEGETAAVNVEAARVQTAEVDASKGASVG